MPKSIAEKFRESAKRAFGARTRRKPDAAMKSRKWEVAEEVDETIEQLVEVSEGRIKLTQSYKSEGIERRCIEIGGFDMFEIRFDDKSARIQPGPDFSDPNLFLSFLQNDFVKQTAKIIAKQATVSNQPLFSEPAFREGSCDADDEQSVRPSVRRRTKKAGAELGRHWAARATVRQLKALLEHFEDDDDPGLTSPWEIFGEIQAGNDESEYTWFDDDGEPWPWDEDPEFGVYDHDGFGDDDDPELHEFWDVENAAELDALPKKFRVGFVDGALMVAKRIRADAMKHR